MPKESLEDQIRRVFTEENEKRTQSEREEKDPWAKLEGTIRRVVGEEFDRRSTKPSAPKQESDEPDDGGFLTAIFGGKGS